MALKVEISSRKDTYAYGEPLRLLYKLTNAGEAPIYVVRDKPKKLPSTNGLELLIGEVDNRNKLRYFDFKAPTLRQIAPGAEVQVRLQIGMPPEKVTIDVDSRSNLEEVPLTGNVKVHLSVGHLRRPFK